MRGCVDAWVRVESLLFRGRGRKRLLPHVFVEVFLKRVLKALLKELHGGLDILSVGLSAKEHPARLCE